MSADTRSLEGDTNRGDTIRWQCEPRQVANQASLGLFHCYKAIVQLKPAASEVVETLFRYRDLLRSIPRLTISLEPANEGFLRPHVSHPAVFNICTFLAHEGRGSRLRSVDVCYVRHPAFHTRTIDESELRSLLWPIALLRGLFTVDISGLGKQSTDLGFNTFSAVQPRHREVCAPYMHCARQISDSIHPFGLVLSREHVVSSFDAVRQLESVHTSTDVVSLVVETTRAMRNARTPKDR